MKADDGRYYILESPVSGGSEPDKIQDWINYLYTLPATPQVMFEVDLAEEQLRQSVRQRTNKPRRKILVRKQ
jgi:hypothetical protein